MTTKYSSDRRDQDKAYAAILARNPQNNRFEKHAASHASSRRKTVIR